MFISAAVNDEDQRNFVRPPVQGHCCALGTFPHFVTHRLFTLCQSDLRSIPQCQTRTLEPFKHNVFITAA